MWRLKGKDALRDDPDDDDDEMYVIAGEWPSEAEVLRAAAEEMKKIEDL